MLLLFIKILSSIHCSQNPIFFKVFPVMNLRSLVLNSYIHISVSDLFIPKISLPIWLQQNRQTNRSQIHECGNWDRTFNSVLEYIRTILDSHWPFICSVVSSLRFTTANYHPHKMGSTNDNMSYALIGFSQIPG